MKKIILATALLSVTLTAEVISVLPYGGLLNYDKASTKSIKDRATLYGAHATIGTWNYLLEVDYLKTDISYKNSSYENLNQDDITLAYGQYFTNFMLRGGLHYINTNDPILGNGYVGFASVGGYNYIGYDKYSYGIETYYSKYDNSISVTQFTPYLSAYNALSLHWGNAFVLKANYQLTPNYVKSSYLSYDVSDTLYYRSVFLTLRGYGGEMVSGVKDSGFTVINTQDLMQNGYGLKLGYYFTSAAIFSLSYDINNYTEVNFIKQGQSSTAMASFYYGF